MPKTRSAHDELEVTVEPEIPGDDLDRVSVGGAIVDVLLSAFTFWTQAFSSVGAPRVSVRVRDRASANAIYEIPCGTNQTLAHGVAESLRREMEGLSVDEFLDEYRIDPDHHGPTWRRAYLGIGSNLGDRLAHLQAGVDGLAAAAGVAVVGVSRVYETDPVGGPPQPEYLNAAVAVDTTLTAHELLDLAQAVEQNAQRVRGERWGPRTLDVDVLILGTEEVHDPDLEIPHPRMRARGFVLAPLSDFLPPGVITPPPGGWPGVHFTDLSLRVP